MTLKKLTPIVFTFFLLVGLSVFIPAISQDFATLSTENQVINPNIKTILLFPSNDGREGAVQPAAVPLRYPYQLVLKFDEVDVDEAYSYNAKILHCDAQWRRSSLKSMEYLYDFNEFNIEQYEFSINRVVPYTHYTFVLPKVKLPGNYLLVVYKNFDQTDIAFVRRFVVYDNKIGIDAAPSIIGSAVRSTDQSIEFTINYSQYQVLNPLQELTVVIRQNDRWDNALSQLKPTIYREDISQLIYRDYNPESSFKAGNEFRFFDLTSVRYNMRNVDRITENEHRIDAYLGKDKFRGYEPYTMIPDLNGGYYIENKDYGNHHIESEYVHTHFFLETPGNVRDNIYLAGRFTDWRQSEAQKMKLVNETGIYTCSMLLKQGMYDYQYLVPGYKDNPNIIEGNHQLTNNLYEILVYYYHPTYRTDLLVGYVTLTSN